MHLMALSKYYNSINQYDLFFYLGTCAAFFFSVFKLHIYNHLLKQLVRIRDRSVCIFFLYIYVDINKKIFDF